MADPISKLDAMLQIARTFGMRDGMLRLRYELQRGSGLMLRKMRSVQSWDSWQLGKIAPDASAEHMLATRRNGTRPFFFSNTQALEPALKKIIGPAAISSALAEAESILAGNFPFFGALSFPCGFPPCWFQNPVTGQAVSPQHPWTQMRFASPIYGDLKFILERSRFLFVYPLARAYALTGDEKFPQAFWTLIEDWAHHSPPMAGPLWICGQESSLRILALSFALHAFVHSPSTTPERVALLVSIVAAHAWRTAQTLGYARSQRSNHLISEAVGLWTAGTLFPELRGAPLWQNLGAALLRESVLDQITPHGVSHQYSYNYQRMILHQLLWTLRLAEIHHAPLHPEIRQRTEAAYDFMRAWVDPLSGHAPNYGSDDGSLILPLAQASYRDFRPLLQLGAAVLDRPALPAGPWDEAALWFGVEPTMTKSFSSVPDISTNSGFFRLGDQNSWALIRAGKYSRRPFQADQLHVDLWWNGLNLARDPGTYLYNGPAPWNNGLAGTAVHNTVTIGGQDQMRRAGRFLWLDWAQASGRAYASPDSAKTNCFDGEHNGYKRFGIVHRRTVCWLGECGWVIVDNVRGSGEHNVRLHWLVADLPFEITDPSCEVVFRAGSSRLRWNIFSSVPGTLAVIRAGKPIGTMTTKQETADSATQRLGWESPTYGALQPALSLVYEVRSQLPVRFITTLLTDEHCNLRCEVGGILISRAASEIYRTGISAAERR